MHNQLTAATLASYGRGPDTALVHMSPKEIAGLQALAQSQGTSLTINPETGLPEAGVLDSLLPALVGGALNYFAPGVGTAIGGLMGLSGAAGTGIAVGALGTLASGSLGKGLMAGLGAYGGASVTGGLSDLGAADIAKNTLASATESATKEGLTGEAYNEAIQKAMSERMSNLSMADRFSAGVSAAKENPKTAFEKIGGLKTLGVLGASMSPQNEIKSSVQTVTPRQSTQYIRRYDYDPMAQRYSAHEPVPAKEGGLMSLANGGSVGYAVGGVTDAEIKSYIDANIGNPQAIATAAQQYGVSAQDLARAGGYSLGQVNDYFTNAGVNFQSPAAVYSAQQGQNLSNTINDWIASNPNATRATIDQQMQQYGISQADLAKALENPAYSANTRAGLLQQNMGLADLNTGITNWLGSHPGATDAQVDAAMQQWGVTGMDVGRALSATGGSKGLEHGLLAGNMGLSGVNSLITNWLAAHPRATYNEAVQELGVSNLNEADVKRATGKTLRELFPVPLQQATNLQPGVGGSTGAAEVGGGTYTNPNGTITTSPVIPGIPRGGFTGMSQVRDAYTAGGGQLGITPSFVPRTVQEMNARYPNTGDSKAMYDYLTGKGPYPYKTGMADVDASGNRVYREVARPYNEAVLGAPANPNKRYVWNATEGTYALNPNYVRTVKTYDPVTKQTGSTTYMSTNQTIAALQGKNLTGNALANWAVANNVDAQTLAAATGMTWDAANALISEAIRQRQQDSVFPAKNGGLMALAKGGLTFQGEETPKEWVDESGKKMYWDFANGVYRPETTVRNGITYRWNPTTNKYEASSGNAGVDTLMNNQTGGPGQDFSGPSSLDNPPGVYGGRTNPLAIDYALGKISGMFTTPKTAEEIAATPVEDRVGTPVGQIGGQPVGTGPMALDPAQRGQAAAREQEARDSRTAQQGSPTDVQDSSRDDTRGPSDTGGVLGGAESSVDPALNANGGMIGRYASGGLGSLGGYSDGGRLLRGPGDGVSDSIPASIGGKQPARLADGEFVVPARIVSELGNGSTEAGARKLYAMMDRIQANRRKTVGKGRVAVNSKSHKYLPA